MKTLAIIIGTLLAAGVLIVAGMAIVLFMEVKSEEYSRGNVMVLPVVNSNPDAHA